MPILKLGKKEKPTPKRGKLIVLDGTDGSGKGTQTRLLVDNLRLSGYDVEMADFPQYDKKSAGMVEEYLNGKYGKLPPKVASIFYAVDRFDASFQIRKWLEAGKIIIANRYVTANAGHQGGNIPEREERTRYFAWLNNLEYEIFNIPKPDLNIIIHVPAHIAQKLVDKKNTSERKYVEGKKRDILEADLKHLRNAEKVYLEIARIFPNTKLVECMADGKLLSPAQVHNKVWELVRRIALKDIKPK